MPFPSRFGKRAEYAKMTGNIAGNDMPNGLATRPDGAIRMAPR